MKKRTKILMLVLLLSLVFVSQSFGFDVSWLNTVYFVNDSGRTIEFLFISPGDSDYWGPEILGSKRILESGDDLGFDILYSDTCATFDILAIDENGEAMYIWDMEVCDGESQWVNFTRKQAREEAPDFEFIQLEVINSTDYDMYYVFISPSDSAHYGVSYLDEYTVMQPADSFEILVPSAGEATAFDFQGVDADSDTYSFTLTLDPDVGDEQYVEIEMGDLD